MSYDPLSPTRFEDLSVELFREIFEYLASHDLIAAFDNLNSRFVSIIRQLPLYLPNNANMSIDIYRSYIVDILPKYRSQIVSLHLAEGRCIGAVDWLLCKVEDYLFSAFTTTLRVIKLIDIHRSTFESLINHFHLVHHVHTLSIHLDIDMSNVDTLYYDQSQYMEKAYYWPTIASALPKLQSLLIFYNECMFDSTAIFNYDHMTLPIAQNIETFTMNDCSWLLITTLLNNGHMPRLRRLFINVRTLPKFQWFVTYF